MIADTLEPRIDLISEEYVLVQAWKKTASHIRYHNWYSDTLELDRTAVNLPRFLADLAEKLKAPDEWKPDPLRIVPAPKAQQWRVVPETKRWEPIEKGQTAAKLRPLAHVTLKDQVAATAIMLCLADRVETIQGDPCGSISNPKTRKRVVSYGNRLFCDADGDNLRHRWGSRKLYRAYYQDYRTFLFRPALAAQGLRATAGSRVFVVHSDLRQFYDRVSPTLLAQKLASLATTSDDQRFFRLAGHLLNWRWDKKDSTEVTVYAKQAALADFSKVALPQGLVAAGFFANVALLDFDQALRKTMSQEIETGVRIEDACRYVDDLRIVLTVDRKKMATDSEEVISTLETLTAKWLQSLLNRHAPGLTLSMDKTKAAAFTGDERPLVRQSRKMARIQGAISGGFDAIAGEEILDAVQGLIRSQERYSKHRTEEQAWPFAPIPDVLDATVARFAAARFRSTYRSLRPLLEDRKTIQARDEESGYEETSGLPRPARSQDELDDEARAFALGLIENWVEDPSNVRLLRIGLDLWPAEDVLKSVLELLQPFTMKGGRRKAPRRVAWYCLAEIFRAGATETGFVKDLESLPAKVDIAAYRSVLRAEAIRLASLPPSTLPWYLKQQVLLFLAANDARQAPIHRTGRSPETRHYREMIQFLKGESDGLTGATFTTLAILSRRAFRGRQAAIQLTARKINVRRLEQIAERDPSFALEILAARPWLAAHVSLRLRDDLCLDRLGQTEGWKALSEVVLEGVPNGPLRNELAILRFASKFLKLWSSTAVTETITPADVLLQLRNPKDGMSQGDRVQIVPSRVVRPVSMYRPPPWCPPDERWRFHLGYLLRFILAAREDFTKVVKLPHWKEGTATYRAPESHWYQRLYGLFNGHAGFGDDWLPISEWVEQLLSALLSWPGRRTSEMFVVVRAGIADIIANIERRIDQILENQGQSHSVLMLPIIAPRPEFAPGPRPLRACVVQTVIPTPADFIPDDLTLSLTAARRRHRNHLSAALAAIERMLDLRETHKGRDGRLDWLILPELSVHPDDVGTHLVPFARAYRTIILAGLTYQELFPGKPYVNSALWVIPVWSPANGLQILTRRQGKRFLAPDEEKLNAGEVVLQGFRPCQWLIGYKWSTHAQDRPLWLTSSVCYDATDLSLATDLRNHSDVFAIPALNKDVSTFDQMALALHYHMFQMVIVANNGLYGGSNAYVPYKESYVRQLFHMHGQPQASIAFLEIDDIAGFIARQAEARNTTLPATNPLVKWKFPPAGL